jgi:DNA-binding CsgD family transcriptional regulator
LLKILASLLKNDWKIDMANREMLINEMSDELLLFRNNQGVQLVTPAAAIKQIKAGLFYDTGYTIASLMRLPFNIYFLNKEGATCQMNKPCVDVCGFQSVTDALGKSLFDVSVKTSASELINNCRQTIQANKIKIFEEENLRHDGVTLRFLSVKSPWYNANNEIIGVFGCSIVLGEQSLAESLLQITELGLLNPSGFMLNSTVIPSILSERESLCVYHLCKGYTMKEIAKMVGLSPKTVETYIDRAKQKLHCQNKAELIARYLQDSASN